MNTNRIIKLIDGIPVMRIGAMDAEIPLDKLALAAAVPTSNAATARMACTWTVAQFAISSDPVIVAWLFVEFLRTAELRRYFLAMRHKDTYDAPALARALERMGWRDDAVYAMAEAAVDVLRQARPDKLAKAVQLVDMVEPRDSVMVHMSLDLRERLEMLKSALVTPEPAPVPPPMPDPEPEQPAQLPEPQPAPEPGVEAVHELDNKQQLVKVRSRDGNIHYIVVDPGVDVKTAPQVWDLINRDELHLSVNVTTDRLRRTTVVNTYLEEGWTPAEAAELMGVPKHIVTGDIQLLRKMGRLGETPGMRKRKPRA